jgi:hypothetical protein
MSPFFLQTCFTQAVTTKEDNGIPEDVNTQDRSFPVTPAMLYNTCSERHRNNRVHKKV